MAPDIVERGPDGVVDFCNAYRNWIGSTMGDGSHEILFDVMMDTEFRWDPGIPRDADRESDGRFLRLEFAEEEGWELTDEELAIPCSFLEFMAALARTIEDDLMYDPDEPDRAPEWFWEMMENSGLALFDDRYMVEGRTLAYQMAVETMNRVMERRYEPNGDKGLFPLKHPMADQREVEIWYQANAYFIEEFFE